MASDIDGARYDALHLAVTLSAGHDNDTKATIDHTLTLADGFYAWLTKPIATTLTITAGTPTPQPGTATPERHPMTSAENLPDNDQVVLTAAVTDAKGQPVFGDTVTWTVDNDTVVTLADESTDTTQITAVAGTVGTATATATDGAVTGTFALTVTAGPAESLVITAGLLVVQPAPPVPGA